MLCCCRRVVLCRDATELRLRSRGELKHRSSPAHALKMAANSLQSSTELLRQPTSSATLQQGTRRVCVNLSARTPSVGAATRAGHRIAVARPRRMSRTGCVATAGRSAASAVCVVALHHLASFAATRYDATVRNVVGAAAVITGRGAHTTIVRFGLSTKSVFGVTCFDFKRVHTCTCSISRTAPPHI